LHERGGLLRLEAQRDDRAPARERGRGPHHEDDGERQAAEALDVRPEQQRDGDEEGRREQGPERGAPDDPEQQDPAGRGADQQAVEDSDFLLARFQGGAGHQPVLTGNTISAPGQSASSTTEPVMFILAEGGPTPSTWTAVYDRANIIVTRKDTGAAYQLPGVKPHGSVNITGSEGPDIITAERVSAVGPLDPNLFQFVYFQTTATTGMVCVSANFVDPVKFQKHIDQTKSNLADAEARLAVSIAEHDPESVTASFREEVNHGKHLVKVAEATLEAMKTTTAFIRYRIDGVYDVYVAISDNMTSKTRIRIDAAGGNDVVAISNNVPLKATLAGGWGADKLTSGKRRSILYGGGGGDRLFSRSRVGGTLDGGKGADKYYTRFSECEVLARNDGDALIINDVPVKVTQCGIFGITGATATGPGKCYYLVAGDEGQTDLLA
ncbi:MAG: hypothetical protein QOE14_209, partial [Humisphaera sp.]|nr:hypothetical protein [Humisphaera sp.]